MELDGGLFMGLGARIGALTGAGFGAVGGTLGATPVQENYTDQQINNDVPAIVQEAPENVGSRSLEDVANQHGGDGFTINVPEEFQESKPDKSQNIRDLGQGMEDLASAGAEVGKEKGKADEIGEQNNALRGPEYAGYTDPPAPEQNTAPEQDMVPSESQGEAAGSAPSVDDGYDYYNGIC
jgi:hypothetical protein